MCARFRLDNVCIRCFFVTFKCEPHSKYLKSPIKYHLQQSIINVGHLYQAPNELQLNNLCLFSEIVRYRHLSYKNINQYSEITLSDLDRQ